MKIGKKIDELINSERWLEARHLIEKALKKEPESHWLWSQLGETYYEERNYQKALELLLISCDIVPDCPLTLWYLANTLDALGAQEEAIRLFTWLLTSRKTAKDDPCWEGKDWADALKTDCVYRIGLCFKRLGDPGSAAQCFYRYIALQSAWSMGSYSPEDARKQIET